MFPSNVESNFDVIFPFDIANISHFFIYKETPWFQSLLLQSPTDVAYIALSNIISEKCLSSKKNNVKIYHWRHHYTETTPTVVEVSKGHGYEKKSYIHSWARWGDCKNRHSRHANTRRTFVKNTKVSVSYTTCNTRADKRKTRLWKSPRWTDSSLPVTSRAGCHTMGRGTMCAKFLI